MAQLGEDSTENKNWDDFSKLLLSIWKKDEHASTLSEEEQTNAKNSKKAKFNHD